MSPFLKIAANINEKVSLLSAIFSSVVSLITVMAETTSAIVTRLSHTTGMTIIITRTGTIIRPTVTG